MKRRRSGIGYSTTCWKAALRIMRSSCPTRLMSMIRLVEVIEGLTKLQNGLCSNLKSLLPEEEEDSLSGSGGGFSGLFGGGFDMEDSDK